MEPKKEWYVAVYHNNERIRQQETWPGWWPIGNDWYIICMTAYETRKDAIERMMEIKKLNHANHPSIITPTDYKVVRVKEWSWK